MNVLAAIGEILVLVGTFFYFLSALGLIRMPDVYNRMQTSTKSATLGSLGVMIGVGIWALGEDFGSSRAVRGDCAEFDQGVPKLSTTGPW